MAELGNHWLFSGDSTSVFVAIWSVLFLVQLSRLRRGKDSYERFVAAQRSPGWMALS